MLQQLFEINFNDLYAVITDEIVIKKDAKFKMLDNFREKNSHKGINQSCSKRFLSSYDIKIEMPIHNNRDTCVIGSEVVNSERLKKRNYKNHQVIFHIGAGGSGKTHSLLTDKGYLNLLYTCPSHKLRNSKQEEFPEVKTEVHYNILNFPRKSDYCYGNELKKVFTPSVIVVDESTIITKKDNKKLWINI